MSTVLTYNGVTLSGCITQSFDQVAQSDPSGTDDISQRFKVKVSCLIHARAAGTQWGGFGELDQEVDLGPAKIEQLRRKLMEKRGEFSYKIGQTTLLEANAKSDVNNGPNPISCNIEKVVGNRTVRVNYEIEIFRTDCPNESKAKSKNKNEVLNNRWSLSDSLDESFYTTRVIRGHLRVSHIDVNPQNYRTLCIPPLSDCFKRMSMTFVTTPNGLEMDYTIVDKQAYAAPPKPATKWSGQQVISTSGNGTVMHMQVTVRLEGPPGVDKAELVTACAQVIQARMGNVNAKSITEHFHVTDQLSEPVVDMAWQIRWKDDMATGLRLAEGLFGTYGMPGYEQHKHPQPKDYGPTCPTGIFVMHVQSPCEPTNTHSVNRKKSPQIKGAKPTTEKCDCRTFQGSPSPGTPGPLLLYTPIILPPGSPGGSYPKGGTGYNDGSHESTVDPMVVALPVGTSGPDSPGSDTNVVKIIAIGQPMTTGRVEVYVEGYGLSYKELQKRTREAANKGVPKDSTVTYIHDKTFVPQLTPGGSAETKGFYVIVHWVSHKAPDKAPKPEAPQQLQRKPDPAAAAEVTPDADFYSRFPSLNPDRPAGRRTL